MAIDGDDNKWKIEIFRDKLRYSLGARFLLRFHVGLILLFTVLVGWAVDYAWLKIGLTHMGVRYVLSILAAYLAFLIGVHFWIEYSGIKQYIRWRKAQELVGEDVPRKNDNLDEWKGFEALADPTIFVAGGEGCFVVFVCLIGFFVAFYFFGGYVFANAVTFFADIVLELLLAAGLLRGIQRYESSWWVMTVWRATRWSLAFSLFVAIAVAWYARHRFPEATTLPEVISAWRAS